MSLQGKKVLILVENGYEDLEFWYPKIRLIEEGAQVTVAGKEDTTYQSKHGYEAQIDITTSHVQPEEYDALIIPGGLECPDKLRRHKEIVDIVKRMNEKGKILAAICHGPWLLISAGAVKGRNATSFFAIKDDMINAGANYQDLPVVVDRNIVTSRTPKDLPDFCKALIDLLKK